jgi:hypothetical protein
MGYSVYYNGEIDVSLELSDEHARLLDEGLTKNNLAPLESPPKTGRVCIKVALRVANR